MPRLTFPRRLRLTRRLDFERVYAARRRRGFGPLLVFGAANGLVHPRIGLSVPRRVGTAVVRNRIKRRLREAFRLDQALMPAGHDMVVVVRPHRPLSLEAYREALRAASRWVAERAARDASGA